MLLQNSAVTRKHTMVQQKYLRGGGQTSVLGGGKYTKCNKISNNSENFRSKIAAREGASAPLAPIVAGLLQNFVLRCN